MTGRGALALVGVFVVMAVVAGRPMDIVGQVLVSMVLAAGLVFSMAMLVAWSGPAAGESATGAGEVGSRSIEDAVDTYGADAVLALCIQLTDPVPDPGHPGGMPLVLWQPPRPFGRIKVLECFNGTAEPDGSYARVAIGVGAEHTDAVAAAAESYGIDQVVYRRMSRRV